jgi:hypothetical protein
MVVVSVGRLFEAMAIRAMITTTTTAAMTQPVGDIQVDVVSVVVVVDVLEPVVADVAGAWFCVWVVVEVVPAVAGAYGSVAATIYACMCHFL